MLSLTPSVTAEGKVTVKDIIAQYQEDLPKPVIWGRKIFLKKRRWKSLSKSDRPSTSDSSLNACDHDMYPNLKVLLRICSAILITYKSGSLTKRLNTYLRASMTKTLLSALALHLFFFISLTTISILRLKYLKKLSIL